MSTIIPFPKICYSKDCIFNFKEENSVRCCYSNAKVTAEDQCLMSRDLRSLDSNFIPFELFEKARLARDLVKRLGSYEKIAHLADHLFYK